MVKTIQTILLLIGVSYLSVFINNLGEFARHNEQAVFINILQSFDIKVTSYILVIFGLTKSSFSWIFPLFFLIGGMWVIVKCYRKSTFLVLLSLYSIAILCYISFPFTLYI